MKDMKVEGTHMQHLIRTKYFLKTEFASSLLKVFGRCKSEHKWIFVIEKPFMEFFFLFEKAKFVEY